MDTLKLSVRPSLFQYGQILVIGICLGGLLLKFVLGASRIGKGGQCLPPGPRPWPVIGNLLDFPTGFEAFHWSNLTALYGPIIYVKAINQPIIIVSDAGLASELLDKRSAKFSNRPILRFAGEMCGLDNALGMLQPGEQFKDARKKIHAYIGTRAAIDRFSLLLEVEARRFALLLLRSPEEFRSHIRLLFGATILKISHGYEVKRDGEDAFVALAQDAMDVVSFSWSGPWAVDLMAFLRYLPSWLPGMDFKDLAKKSRRTVHEFVKKPGAFVRQQMAKGEAKDSFAIALYKDIKDESDEQRSLWTASVLYGGGADTTVSALATFFLGIVLHPQVQARAQEEIDRVTNGDRLPILADRPNLPYVDAITKEAFRWNLVAPMGTAHASSADDIIEGYFIPKGSIIMPNVWHMCHDPSVYKDPFDFKPERFLGCDGRAPEPDPRNLIFGFGRRICPGKELADPSIFIAIATTLAAFSINKERDARGREIEPVCEYTPGVISHPKDFRCTIVPRSEMAAALVEAVQEAHPFEPSDYGIWDTLKWE